MEVLLTIQVVADIRVIICGGQRVANKEALDLAVVERHLIVRDHLFYRLHVQLPRLLHRPSCLLQLARGEIKAIVTYLDRRFLDRIRVV